jgi:hypothetical protein
MEAAGGDLFNHGTGKKLCDGLRKLATNDGSPVILQIMALERELASLDAESLGKKEQ